MKILIAVLSCHSLRYCEDSLRGTWLPELPSEVDYKFFLGYPKFEPELDEVFLPVDDSFEGITHKSVAVFQWGRDSGYDFGYKCDLDTLVRPKLLLTSGFEQHDYVGGRNGEFASGGSGYWLSKSGMDAKLDCPVVRGPAEDVHTACAMREHGIKLHADSRYKYYPGDVMDDETISYHLSSIRSFGKISYDPRWMYETWADQKSKNYKRYSTFAPAVPVIEAPVPQKRGLRRPGRLVR